MEDVHKELKAIKERLSKIEEKLKDPEGELKAHVKRGLAKARLQPDSTCVRLD